MINWNSFSIGDTTGYEPYIKGGICRNINVPQKVKYESLDKCVEDFDKYLDSSLGIYDFEKMGDNYAIFVCYQAYAEFVRKNGSKPRNWVFEDS